MNNRSAHLPMLTIPENYFRRYGHHLSNDLTKRQAWEAVEQELQDQTGCALYDTYDAFRVGLHNWRSGHIKTRVVLRVCAEIKR